MNLSVHVPPNSTIRKITRAIEADERSCRSKASAIVILIHHTTAPPRCDTLLSSIRVYSSVDTALNVSLCVSQSEECCHHKTAINVCSLTERILDILVACKVGNILLQVTINLAGNIGVRQTQLVVKCAVCRLKIGKLRSDSRYDGSLALSISRIISCRNIGKIRDEFRFGSREGSESSIKVGEFLGALQYLCSLHFIVRLLGSCEIIFKSLGILRHSRNLRRL